MAAASINFNFSFATRPITSTRSSSPLLIAVLFNKTSLAGGFSLRGHFYSVREGTLSNSFNTQTIGAMAAAEAVNNGKCKVLLNRYLSAGGGKSSRFCTKGAQRTGGGQNNEGEPNIRLDAESGWA